jgi:CDP-glycerol glycerophosphotransferase (TagB/SpsB family)
MEKMGALIAQACLEQPNVRFIYKPHPRVLDSNDSRITENNSRIVAAIERAARQDPSAGHAVHMKGDILALFPRIDVLISDVSSVALDFLYLRPEKPIIMTDRRDDVEQLRIDAPLSVATEVITPSNIQKASEIVAKVLSSDEHIEHRHQLREFYFDNVRSGESTARFFDALRAAMTTHRADMERARDLARRGTGPQLKAKG